MTSFDLSKLSTPEAYKLLIGSVVPRPIAWVGTVSEAGIYNLAPFSFFTAVCSNPPTVLFCPVTPQDRDMKDTLKNIRATKEFVVNIANEGTVEKMNQTSAPYPFGTSEFDAVGLTAIPGVKVRAPRVKESPIQLECTLRDIHQIGDGTAGSGYIVIGEVVQAHVDDAAIDAGMHIDISKIKPVSRLAGTDYAPVRDVFSLKRPTST